MAVNDFCRLCDSNLRVHGVISSKLIFDSQDKEQSIFSQLAKLALVLDNTPARVCRKCCSVIVRLQVDMEIFEEWKKKVTLETCQEEGASSTDKRDETHPPKPQGPFKSQGGPWSPNGAV